MSREWPQQAMGHQPLTGEWPEPKEPPSDSVQVVCRERQGGDVPLDPTSYNAPHWIGFPSMIPV